MDWAKYLASAAASGKLDACKLSLQELKAAGRKVMDEVRGDLLRSPLPLAAESGHTEVCRLLLDAGFSVDVTEEPGVNSDRALHLAIENGHLETAKLLLDRGADLDGPGVRGFTPLHKAASSARIEAIEFLLQSGAKIDARSYSGETPLHIACREKSAEAAQLLMARGASLKIRDEENKTPLHTASAYGLADVVRQMINLGADVNARSAEGNGPLHMAARYGRHECMEVLVRSGARLDLEANDGNTPLHVMASFSKEHPVFAEKSCETLLRLGADPNAHNWSGRRPIHLALDAQNVGSIKALLKSGTKPEKIDGDLDDLLSIRKQRSKEIALLLVSHHVQPSGPTLMIGSLQLKGLTAKAAAIHGNDVDRLADLLAEQPLHTTPEDEPKALMALAKRLKRTEALSFLSAFESQRVMATIRSHQRSAP